MCRPPRNQSMAGAEAEPQVVRPRLRKEGRGASAAVMQVASKDAGTMRAQNVDSMPSGV